MNAARVSKSPRLQRVLGVLWGGIPIDGFDLSRRAFIYNPNQAVRELRKQGYVIECRNVKESFDAPSVFEYRLIH
jgi:hypothetical protein